MTGHPLPIALTLLATLGPLPHTKTPPSIPAALDIAARIYPTACHPQVFATSLKAQNAISVTDEGPDPQECVIVLDSGWRKWSQAFLCADIVHEVGHLAGLQHTTDRKSPMWGGGAHRIAQCPGRFHWGGWGQ